MKKINAIAWILTVLMTMASSPAFAAFGTNYEVEVGKTLRLDISDLGIEFMANGSSYTWEITPSYVGDDTNYNEYLTFTSKSKNYAIVKGLKASKLIGIQYTGHYYHNGIRKEFYDAFYVRVVAPGTPSTGPASLEVFPTPQTMRVGETKWVYVKQTRSIGGTYFYSEDKSIATVTHGELASPNSYTTAAQITAKKPGKVNIVAKNANGLTDICEVTVKPQPVTSVSIQSILSLEVGGTHTLTPTITPSDAETSFIWISDNISVATVSQSGKVTARNAGTANIKVTTDSGETATCKVTVTAKSVTSVSIPSTLSLEVGETYTLTPTVTPSDASTSFTWSSDNSSVAVVSETGVVTAKDAGTANVTVQTGNGKAASCEVTVKAPAVPEYVVRFTIHGYEHGQVLYNGSKLAGENGSYSGSFKVAEGDDVPLTILPDKGYRIKWLWVDYKDVADQLVDNLLTIHDIRSDITLTVSFEEADEPVVTESVYLHLNVGDGGYITYGDTTIMGENKIGANEGDDISIRIVANEGYHIGAVKLDGTDVKSQLVENELTIMNMTVDKNLTVSFEADETAPDEPADTTKNTMTMSNVTATPGTIVKLPIGLNNVDGITAFQMDLHLPAGITPATDETGDVIIETSSRVSSRHSVDCSKMEDGSYRIICYSTRNDVFTGNSGELIRLMLAISEDITDGDYEVTATGIEMSDQSGTAYTGKDVTGYVTVESYIMGDTDNNGKHSINDAVCIINHVLGHPNASFNEKAADLDGNGRITVNDAVLLISRYILATPSNVRQATRAAMTSSEDNYMSIEDMLIRPGETKTIEVLMTNNNDNIKGIQCDITLPEGVSFLFNEDADDYVAASSRIPRKLALSSNMQSENTLRVAGVCTSNSYICDNSGPVFTFKVKADDNIKAGIYEIQLSNIELSDGEAIDIPDRTSTLEVIGDVTGLNAAPHENGGDTPFFDLKGRRINPLEAKKGIYIINGKKVFKR